MASFKEAFREARASGDKTFKYNGKSYTTDLAPAAESSGGRTRATKDMPEESTGGRTRASAATQPGVATPATERDPRISNLTTRGGAGVGYGRSYGKGDESKEPDADMYKVPSTESDTRTPKRARNLTDMVGLSSPYAKGGSVGSASKRADGCAERGKTRGKMY